MTIDKFRRKLASITLREEIPLKAPENVMPPARQINCTIGVTRTTSINLRTRARNRRLDTRGRGGRTLSAAAEGTGTETATTAVAHTAAIITTCNSSYL